MTNKRSKQKRKSGLVPNLDKGENLLNEMTSNSPAKTSCGGKKQENTENSDFVIEEPVLDDPESLIHNSTQISPIKPDFNTPCGGIAPNTVVKDISIQSPTTLKQPSEENLQISKNIMKFVEDAIKVVKDEHAIEMATMKSEYDTKIAQLENEMEELKTKNGDIEIMEKIRREVAKSFKEEKAEWDKAKLTEQKEAEGTLATEWAEYNRNFNQEQVELKQKVENLEKSCNFMSKETSTIKEKAEAVVKKVKEQGKFVKVLKHRADDQEDRSRRYNIRIYDIEEKDDENCEMIVKSLFKSLDSSISLPIDRAHRLGKPAKDRIRPIIVKMTYYSHKQLVLKRIRMLNKNDRPFGVGEDFSKETFDIRKRLMEHLNKAKEWNRNVQGGHINYRTLVVKYEVDGEHYTKKNTLSDIFENPSNWYQL